MPSQLLRLHYRYHAGVIVFWTRASTRPRLESYFSLPGA
jgi:hypothetical protein